MPNSYDAEVIVVGAGPAGATAATALAQQGHEVLLLDRSPFPRDKVCGDAISREVVSLLYSLGMKEKILKAEAQGEFYPLDSFRLVSPHLYSLDVPFPPNERTGAKSYVAPRIYLDATIQQHAIDNGATFAVADVKEPLVEDGVVTGVMAQMNGELRSLRSKIVIGADGVTSPIMRHLRPESEQHEDKHRAVALRAYVEGLDFHRPHEVEFFLYDEILPGYAWIFPAADDMANVGLGMRLDNFRRLKGNLKKMLQDFLDAPFIRERLHDGYTVRDVATWQLNFGSQPHMQHAFDGAMLIGDAAGFINPLTGGGIHNAVVSAKLAANTADMALKQGDVSRNTLRVYEEKCNAEMASSMRKSYIYQRLLDHFPSIVDVLIRTASRNSGIADIFLTKL